MKKKEIMLDDVLKSIVWKEFCEIDKVIYSSLVQKFYSSGTVLEGHDVILRYLNQTNVIITTDILAKVFGRKWYDEVDLDRNDVISEFFDNVKPSKDFPVMALKNEYKILHNLCTHSLLPRSNNRYSVNDTDLKILYHLTHRKRVNLPYFMNPKLTSSDPGLLKLSQFHTAALTSLT